MNDELSPREHADMRDLVMAGAQRIRPVGKHRMQIVAGAAAFVLIAGIAGGAVATATLLRSDANPAPVATPTRSDLPAPTVPATPTPAPTPTAAPEQPASTGVMPFGGECANVLSEEEAAVTTGMHMIRSDYRWQTGADAVLGGIDCVWVTDEVYLAATVHVFAYPEAVVPAELASGTTSVCRDVDFDTSRVECSAVEVVDGTWLLVRASGARESVSLAATETLLSSASARLDDHAAPAPAERTGAWWTPPDCATIAAAVDPAVYGYERVAATADQPIDWYAPDRPEGISYRTGAASLCALHFASGSGETTTGEVVTVSAVPGGGVSFPTALAADHSVPVTVEGAAAAVIAPGLDRYEGSGSVIVATDGVNLLTVTPDWVRDTSEAAELAAVLFGLMHP
ncbi:hypothetical protein HF576_07770 [Microbacterium sp. CFH 90308]|uniref:Uncharacterized protein n=1 Tax=Microbacterium salsuginis TaxID=2722803 RepID=A0ABX1K9Q5_9MICO|nr:hypothetical protein [Microbacterium sp. CFH 90308]NLP83741.1 hypothetical protein [Microbacterium sp. CFH 90308]